MPITLTRALLVILIPGGIFLAPWILLFLISLENFDASEFYTSYKTPINAMFFACIVVIGTIIEGLNSHIEVGWDKERESKFEVTENWYKYLALTPANEPVAFSYISKMVTVMYFELAMMWASISFLVGASAIICTLEIPYYMLLSTTLVALSIALFFYFRWQGKTTHEVLCNARKELNARLKS